MARPGRDGVCLFPKSVLPPGRAAIPDDQRIIAVGLLTERDLTALGQGFKRAFPIEDHHEFDELLRQIDEAEAGLKPAG